jgi:hypothetical protein
MNECEGDVSRPIQMIYPYLLATYPDFCLFELGAKTFKASYIYDNQIRKAQLKEINEVIVDITIKDKPIIQED